MTIFCEETTRTLNDLSHSVGGVTVSMVAFQAVDPGSTPGRRIVFLNVHSKISRDYLILLNFCGSTGINNVFSVNPTESFSIR